MPVRLPFRPPGQKVATPSLLTTPFDVKTKVAHAYRATADAVDSRETRTEQATPTRAAVSIVNALASTTVLNSEQLQTAGQGLLAAMGSAVIDDAVTPRQLVAPLGLASLARAPAA